MTRVGFICVSADFQPDFHCRPVIELSHVQLVIFETQSRGEPTVIWRSCYLGQVISLSTDLFILVSLAGI